MGGIVPLQGLRADEFGQLAVPCESGVDLTVDLGHYTRILLLRGVRAALDSLRMRKFKLLEKGSVTWQIF